MKLIEFNLKFCKVLYISQQFSLATCYISNFNCLCTIFFIAKLDILCLKISRF